MELTNLRVNSQPTIKGKYIKQVNYAKLHKQGDTKQKSRKEL